MSNEFNWNDTIEFCLELKSKYLREDNTLLEAVARTIINRSYYSAFRLTYNHLFENCLYQYDENSPSSHKDMINELILLSKPRETGYYNKLYNKVSVKLFEMKKTRKLADYNETPLNFPKIQAQNILSIAQEIKILIDDIQKDINKKNKK